jgi:hypothetical protein
MSVGVPLRQRIRALYRWVGILTNHQRTKKQKKTYSSPNLVVWLLRLLQWTTQTENESSTTLCIIKSSSNRRPKHETDYPSAPPCSKFRSLLRSPKSHRHSDPRPLPSPRRPRQPAGSSPPCSASPLTFGGHGLPAPSHSAAASREKCRLLMGGILLAPRSKVAATAMLMGGILFLCAGSPATPRGEREARGGERRGKRER